MRIGQTVYYRLTEEDAKSVNMRRLKYQELRRMFVRHDEKTPQHLGAGHLFEMMALALTAPEGDPVDKGMLLPAEVVRCFSAAEIGHDMFGDAPGEGSGPGILLGVAFSGIASLRVSLTGNDTLWVDRAKEDVNPLADHSFGHGVTALPACGMFTQSVPAELFN